MVDGKEAPFVDPTHTCKPYVKTLSPPPIPNGWWGTSSFHFVFSPNCIYIHHE